MQPPAAAPVPPEPVPCRSLPDGEVILYTDGAAKGNPGDAGAGALILSATGETILETGSYLGIRTNNVAEYLALLLGLKQAARLGARTIAIRVDSELIARQVNGVYKVRDEKLKPLFQEIKAALGAFRKYTISHVPRAANQRADQLANEAIVNRTIHADLKAAMKKTGAGRDGGDIERSLR